MMDVMHLFSYLSIFSYAAWQRRAKRAHSKITFADISMMHANQSNQLHIRNTLAKQESNKYHTTQFSYAITTYGFKVSLEKSNLL